MSRTLAPSLLALAAASLVRCAPDGAIPLPLDRPLTSALAQGPPDVEGVWTTLPDLIAINPIHAVLLREVVTRTERETLGGRVGTVLVASGSGDDVTQVVFQSEVRDLGAGTVTSHPMLYDAFCSGITHLADGNPFIVGGTYYDGAGFDGISDVQVYNVNRGAYGSRPSMANPRWYPTATLLPDGRVMVDAGWSEYQVMNATVSIYTPGGGWSAEYPMGFEPMFYPRQHVLPDGRVFKSGPENDAKMFDPAAVSLTDPAWSLVDWTNFSSTPGQYNREYGASVMLPLTPDNAYDPVVMIMGGFTTAPTATTERIDLGVPSPVWQWGPTMAGPRVRMNAVLLPDGQVLALGGSTIDYDPFAATLRAELYDPDTDTFSSAGDMAYARLDHSVALLLPDATVWVAGSQGVVPTFEQHMEVYEPPYLFEADGTYAYRPVIDHAPDRIGYGASFVIRTDEDDDIASIVLAKPGAVTHSFDTDQRIVGLAFTQAANPGRLRVTGPPDANIAPPGDYMLFLVTADGRPSVAPFVRLE